MASDYGGDSLLWMLGNVFYFTKKRAVRLRAKINKEGNMQMCFPGAEVVDTFKYVRSASMTVH